MEQEEAQNEHLDARRREIATGSARPADIGEAVYRKYKFAPPIHRAVQETNSRLCSFIVGSNVEHKTEHNNCRMRGLESDFEALHPTVSS